MMSKYAPKSGDNEKIHCPISQHRLAAMVAKLMINPFTTINSIK